MKTNIRKAVVLWAMLIGLILLVPFNAFAQTLQPRLLWEKKLPFKGGVSIAYVSGDVIACSRDARQIIAYDKNGNEFFHWGPRVDRQPMGCEISDDGNVLLYTTTFTESYLERKKIPGEWDKRVHYATRKGKELWNKPVWGGIGLSPDGKMVVNYTDGNEGQDINVYDSQGKTLWTFGTNYVETLAFSPDSQYLGFQGDGYYLMDKAGNVLWRKTDIFVSSSSISDMAKYVYLDTGRGPEEAGKVYDKQGNLVFEGNARLSLDGSKLLIPYTDRTVILSLPDKTVIKEYPYHGFFVSHDGRFLFVNLGVRGKSRIIDTSNGEYGDFDLLDKGVTTSSAMTKDGKYMVIVVDGNKILYYQLY